MNVTGRPDSDTQSPQFEFRCGGLRLTIQRVPVRLLTALAACGGTAFAAWVTAR